MRREIRRERHRMRIDVASRVFESRPLGRVVRIGARDVHEAPIGADEIHMIVGGSVRHQKIAAAVGRTARDDRRRRELRPESGVGLHGEKQAAPHRAVRHREVHDIRAQRMNRERFGAEPAHRRCALLEQHGIVDPRQAGVVREIDASRRRRRTDGVDAAFRPFERTHGDVPQEFAICEWWLALGPARTAVLAHGDRKTAGAEDEIRIVRCDSQLTDI